VGRRVLRLSDRAFTAATSTSPVARFARTRVAGLLLPLAARVGPGRAYVFRTASQLGIRYRGSPLSVDGAGGPRRGPKAGDRLPDVAVLHNGRRTTTHAVTAAACWHLLLCGHDRQPTGHRETLSVHRVDGWHDGAVYLVRPDGHIGYRGGAADAAGLAGYLTRWLPP
jgi:hypothetical protein